MRLRLLFLQETSSELHLAPCDFKSSALALFEHTLFPYFRLLHDNFRLQWQHFALLPVGNLLAGVSFDPHSGCHFLDSAFYLYRVLRYPHVHWNEDNDKRPDVQTQFEGQLHFQFDRLFIYSFVHLPLGKWLHLHLNCNPDWRGSAQLPADLRR